MITVTAKTLKAIAPRNRDGKLLSALATEMNTQFYGSGLDTKEEISHFIAQAAHETGSFNSLIEGATGEAYEMRKDLGNTVAGYGKLFKGRGIFQITGFSNYSRMSQLCPENISFVANPELLAQPRWAVWSAIVYWNERHLGDVALHPDSWRIYSKYAGRELTPVEYITLRINGGFNGLDNRKIFYERAKKVII